MNTLYIISFKILPLAYVQNIYRYTYIVVYNICICMYCIEEKQTLSLCLQRDC